MKRYVGANPCFRPLGNAGNKRKRGQAQVPAPTNGKLPLGDLVGRFESFTMHQYIFGVRNHNWVPFYKKLWQRNYYEHIIRDEMELNKIRQYIIYIS